MPVDRTSAVRLAAAIAGLENHEERIRHDAEYAYKITKNVTLIREYHAVLGISKRLELLARDALPPVTFDVLDIADGALRPPFMMLRADELALLKRARQLLGKSPVAKIEITEQREIVLWAYVYDDELRRSVLRPLDTSAELSERKAG